MWLKQSTAVTIRLGPALDKTDGVTEETGLSPSVEVSKNHAAFAARNSASAITHDSNGWYAVPIDATDTGTLGPLIVKFDDAATHLPVWREFLVVPAHVYDGLVAGTDNLQVDTVQWLGTACATPTVAGVPEVDPTHWNGTAVATPDTVGYPKVTIKDGTGTGELDTNAGKVALTDASVDTIWDEALAGHAGAGTAGKVLSDAATAAALTIVDDFLDTEVAAIKAKTDLIPADPADESNVLAAIAAVQADTDNIQTRLPAALVGGRMDSDVAVIQANAVSASALAADAVDEILDEVVEGAVTLRQAIRILLSFVGAKVTGGGTTTLTYRDIGDTKSRITQTVDSSGNRSASTLDGS